MASAAYGLRLPASASCLGRHLRLAGRCPNNSSLFPPLAAVVVVASHFQRKNDLDFRDTGASADAPVSLFHGRMQAKTAKAPQGGVLCGAFGARGGVLKKGTDQKSTSVS